MQIRIKTIGMVATATLLWMTQWGWAQGNDWHWLSGGKFSGIRFWGQEGLVVGNDGRQGLILRSTDGGTNWAIQPQNTGKPSFSRIRFIDNQNGWIWESDNLLLDTRVQQ